MHAARPAFEKAIANTRSKVTLVKLDIDGIAIAGQLRMGSIPAVMAFDKGQPMDGLSARCGKPMRRFIERLVGPLTGGSAALLAEADGPPPRATRPARRRSTPKFWRPIRATPKPSGVSRSFRSPRVSSPRRGRYSSGPRGAGGQGAGCGGRRRLGGVAPGRTGLERRGARALEQAVAANPNDHQARFDLAVALSAKGDRAGAADQLIEIIKRDRKWNDEAARKQLLQLFEAWGLIDPASVAARRKLSAIWF